jgi:hypothetical protein
MSCNFLQTVKSYSRFPRLTKLAREENASSQLQRLRL